MTTTDTVVIERVHPFEYTLPLKPSAQNGGRRQTRNFVLRVHGRTADGTLVVGTGEGTPRGATTGDPDIETSWSRFRSLARGLVGKQMTVDGAVADQIWECIEEVLEDDVEEHPARSFRGSVLGVEMALLDLMARARGSSVAEILGIRRRTIVPNTTLMKGRNPRRLARNAPGAALRGYEVLQVSGSGEASADLETLRALCVSEREAKLALWLDLRGRSSVEEAKKLLQGVASEIREGRFPGSVIIEQPLPESEREALPVLQRYVDTLTEDLASADVRVMVDESIWAVEDLKGLIGEGGCRALNVKPAQAGGLSASLGLVEAALTLDPEIHVAITPSPGQSEIGLWALVHLMCALPRIDYSRVLRARGWSETFVEPALEGAKLTLPLDAPGFGVRFKYEAAIPYVRKHAWYPRVEEDPSGEHANEYEVTHLREFGKSELDNHILEKECLALGLSTIRLSPFDFKSYDRLGRSIGFSWMRSSASARPSIVMTTDKHSTRLMLERSGVPVPKGRTFRADKFDAALAFAEELGYPLVLKPLRGMGGQGVVTGISDDKELRWAFDALSGTSYEGQDIIVEEQIEGTSARIYVVGDRALSMIQWPHGTMRGRGNLTVGELLLKKHKMRMQNPHLMNRPIKLDGGTEHQLERQGVDYDSVLPHGQEAVFTLNPNPQQGGETRDAIQEVHPSFIEASVQAVKAIPGLAFSGVDWIIPDHKKPLSDQRAAICELNARPSYGGHEFPLYGEAGPIARSIVQLNASVQGLETAVSPSETVNVRLLIKGDLPDRSFLPWLAKRARQSRLQGWVRQWGATHVEAHLSGSTDLVAALCSLAVVGPKTVKVKSVETSHLTMPVMCKGFEVLR